MYIIMKLIYVGIFFMLIIILQIYKIIGEKGKIIKETFDLIKKFKLQDRFRKDSIRYRLETGDKNSKTKQVLKDISYQNFNDFIMLDSNNVLVPYKNTVEGYDNQTLKKTKKDIDKCRSLTKCEQLKLNPQCGYCGTTNKFDYNMGGKIAPDVCPNHNTRGNMWTSGNSAVYDCKKMKEQLLCDNVKNCTQMENGSKIGRLCGWCPGDSKAKVKNSAKVLKYPNKKEKFPTKIKGDTCKDLGVAKPARLGGGVWFKELVTAGNCPECEKPDAQGNATGANGGHNDRCLNSLWQAPFTLKNIKVKCNTKYNDKNARANYYKSSPYRNMPYYRLSGEMQSEINLPILNFQKDYNKTSSWDQPHEKPPRRRYNMYQIDNYWKRCFGQNRKKKFT